MSYLLLASQLTLTLWFALFKAHDYYDYAQKEQTYQKGKERNRKLGCSSWQKEQQDTGNKNNIKGKLKAGPSESATHIDLPISLCYALFCRTNYSFLETLMTAITATSQNSIILQETLRDLRIGLQQLYGYKAPHIMLYGSYARGDAHEHSDVDILLLFADAVKPGPEIRRLSYLSAELNLRYQLLVSLQPVSEEQFQNADGPFWAKVRREGVMINGR